MQTIIFAVALCFLLAIDAKGAFDASHFAGKAISPKACSSAGLQHLKSCILAYAQHYYSAALTNIPDYHSFHQRRLDYLIMGDLEGQRQVCTWVKSMDTCTSLINMQCMNIYSLQQIGLSLEDAKDYVIDHDISIFECGPGYSALLANYACLTATALNSGAALQMCDDALANAINNDVTHICNAFNAYAACEGAVYRNACNAVAGNLVCNVTVVGIEAGSEHICDSQMHACGPLPPAVPETPIDWIRNKAAALVHHI